MEEEDEDEDEDEDKEEQDAREENSETENKTLGSYFFISIVFLYSSWLVVLTHKVINKAMSVCLKFPILSRFLRNIWTLLCNFQ